jgi:hypothetical protein
VDNLEVDESRAVGFSIVNDVLSGRVTVRPTPVEFIAPKLMGPVKFRSCCFQNLACQRTVVQMVPETFPGELVETDCSVAQGGSAKSIAIEHSEAVCLPLLPFFGSTPKADRYA